MSDWDVYDEADVRLDAWEQAIVEYENDALGIETLAKKAVAAREAVRTASLGTYTVAAYEDPTPQAPGIESFQPSEQDYFRHAAVQRYLTQVCRYRSLASRTSEV